VSSAADRWNARYGALSDPGEPAAFVTMLEPYLDGLAAAIDLGGGAGRNARWLAARGLTVTVVDVAAAGLALVPTAENPRLSTIQRDLEADGWPEGTWDLALFHFYFHRALVRAAPAHLRPGGLLAVMQPTVRNLERHDRPPRPFLLEEGELAGLAAELGVVPLVLSEGWTDEDRHVAQLVARVPLSTTAP
jgi:SAM-dependent methyltransferase